MMFKDKRVRLCFSFLVLMVFAGVGGAWGQGSSGNELLPNEKMELIWEYPGFDGKSLLAETWLNPTGDVSTDSSEPPFMMAQADTDEVDEEESISPECISIRVCVPALYTGDAGPSAAPGVGSGC